MRRLYPPAIAVALLAAAANATAQEAVSFANDVWPILQDRCVTCHDAEKHKGDFRVDTTAALRTHIAADGNIVPSDAAASHLIELISLPADDPDRMPGEGDPLTADQIATLTNWINQGAATGRVDFATDVLPIFSNTCIECHGPETEKADLRLDTAERILAGSDGGSLFNVDDVEDSEILYRVTLPADDADVMPPEGEGDHLTDAQVAAIRTWIADGAFFGGWESIESSGSLEPQLPEVDPADEGALAALREAGALAMPLAQNTNLLTVDFRAEAENIGDSHLALLQPVRTQLAWLNLARTNISDAGLAQLSGMPNLMRLHLENTAISDAGVAHLRDLGSLEYLNLYGTKITDAGLIHLTMLPKLSRLYVWQTGVSDAAAAALTDVRGAYVNTGWKPAPVAEEPAEEAPAPETATPAPAPEPEKAVVLPIKQIMAQAHDDGLINKVLEGAANDQEKAQLVAFYEMLITHEAPKGDQDDWKMRTAALLDAARAVVAEGDPALEGLKNASNCRACHELHKP